MLTTRQFYILVLNSDVLRRSAIPTPLPQDAAPDYVSDAVAEGFIKEPIDDWIDGAVGVAKPESEWQKPGELYVKTDVRQERDDVVGEPADDKDCDDRHQEAHDRPSIRLDCQATRRCNPRGAGRSDALT